MDLTEQIRQKARNDVRGITVDTRKAGKTSIAMELCTIDIVVKRGVISVHYRTRVQGALDGMMVQLHRGKWIGSEQIRNGSAAFGGLEKGKYQLSLIGA